MLLSGLKNNNLSRKLFHTTNWDILGCPVFGCLRFFEIFFHITSQTQCSSHNISNTRLKSRNITNIGLKSRNKWYKVNKQIKRMKTVLKWFCHDSFCTLCHTVTIRFALCVTPPSFVLHIVSHKYYFSTQFMMTN